MSTVNLKSDTEFVQLTDDTRYTVKQLHTVGDDLKESIVAIGVEQSDMRIAQKEAMERQATLEAAVLSNSEALRSLETRFGSMEGSLNKILSILQDKATNG